MFILLYTPFYSRGINFRDFRGLQKNAKIFSSRTIFTQMHRIQYCTIFAKFNTREDTVHIKFAKISAREIKGVYTVVYNNLLHVKPSLYCFIRGDDYPEIGVRDF